jgi:hypothetical protein
MASKLHDHTSSGFMDGAPIFASQIYNLDTETLLRSAVDVVLLEGNKSLQAELLDDERWAPWAENVRIEWDGMEFGYVLDGSKDDVDVMRSIEYGDGTTPPTPVLRKHLVRLSESTSRVVEAALEEVVGLG